MTRFLTSCLCVALFSTAWGQASNSQVEPQIGFTITRLPPAVYPPIALAAHVSGDVVLNITLRPDGAIDSVEVTNGPPMLRQAAIESIKQARFECVICSGASKAFQINYRFDLGPSITCGSPDSTYPRVTHLANIVTIAAQPFGTCDPTGTVESIRVRSAKCLFLWKCEWRQEP
jgi:TonB family protein